MKIIIWVLSSIPSLLHVWDKKTNFWFCVDVTFVGELLFQTCKVVFEIRALKLFLIFSFYFSFSLISFILGLLALNLQWMHERELVSIETGLETLKVGLPLLHSWTQSSVTYTWVWKGKKDRHMTCFKECLNNLKAITDSLHFSF